MALISARRLVIFPYREMGFAVCSSELVAFTVTMVTAPRSPHRIPVDTGYDTAFRNDCICKNAGLYLLRTG